MLRLVILGRSTSVRLRQLATWLLLALLLPACGGPSRNRTDDEADGQRTNRGGLPPAAARETRVALVIGNGAYTHMRPLKNPVNDANAVRAALRRLGFEVTLEVDANLMRMDDAFERFRSVAEKADIAMVFYSGHGAAIDGENYLIPVDAAARSPRNMQRQSVSLSSVQADAMSAQLSVIVLDACRNNPFSLEMVPNRSFGDISIQFPELPLGEMFIGYATEPGTTADDGEGLYSPYTTSLLKHLETPNLSLQEIFNLATMTTKALTFNQQEPWWSKSRSVSKRYCLMCDALVPEDADEAAQFEVSERLHSAVEAGDIAVVEELLAAGADVNSIALHGRTPLHLAAEAGDIAVVEELLAAGADVNSIDLHGRTPLHLVAEAGDIAVVEELLAAGANVHARDNGDEIPYAFHAFLDTRVRRSLAIIQPFSSREGWVSLEAMGIRSDGGATPLHWAAAYDNASAVVALLAGGSDGAATSRLFSVPPFTPDRQIRPLSAATALHWAAEVDAVDAVRAFLLGGMDVDTRDSNGATVLHRAAHRGASRTVTALLAAGANVALTSYRGETALHIAARAHEPEIVEQLLAAGATVNARVGGGDTPLHWSLSAQENRMYSRGTSDQLRAVSLNAIRTLQTLFEHGADAGLMNNAGETPLELAMRMGNIALAEIAASAGADWQSAGVRSTAAADRTIEREVGEVFRECAMCPLMTVVPTGTFLKGSPPSAVWAGEDDEQQEKTIAAPFAVGVYEVTFAEWDACVADEGCHGYIPDDNGWGRDNKPVINVGWDDALAYLRWLSRKTGGDYRLLTENEWEYVARAGTTTARYWGDDDPFYYDNEQCTYANGADLAYMEQTSRELRQTHMFVTCNDGAAATAHVGSYQPNVFGLHDVLGNVWELTSDCGRLSGGGAWYAEAQTGEDCRRRVIRGGSWYAYPGSLRAARRAEILAGERNFFDRGFRVARELH